MARVKKGVTAHARHKKILKLAKGYRGTRSRLFKKANETVIHELFMSSLSKASSHIDLRRNSCGTYLLLNSSPSNLMKSWVFC